METVDRQDKKENINVEQIFCGSCFSRKPLEKEKDVQWN